MNTAENSSIFVRLLRAIFLWPFSLLFRTGVWIRNYTFDVKWRKSRRLPVRVIAIGNLSVGGTGKTPMAEFLAQRLMERGLKPAYLSRGYGRRSRGYLRVAPETHGLSDVGDEALQVARKFPEMPVAVCENRVQGIKELMHECGRENIDCILLDDAFQHRQIYRDIDVVMIDAARPPWEDSLLPYGRLREPLSSLKRADLIVVNKILGDDIIRSFQKRIHQKDICFTRIKPVCLVPFSQNNKALFRENVQRRNCIAFSGLGNNDQYRTEIGRFGMMVVRFYRFSDHHAYREKDIEKIVRKFRRMQAQNIFIAPPVIVTTEKDFMRLRNVDWFMKFSEEFPFYYLEITLEIIRGADKFDEVMNKTFKGG